MAEQNNEGLLTIFPKDDNLHVCCHLEGCMAGSVSCRILGVGISLLASMVVLQNFPPAPPSPNDGLPWENPPTSYRDTQFTGQDDTPQGCAMYCYEKTARYSDFCRNPVNVPPDYDQQHTSLEGDMLCTQTLPVYSAGCNSWCNASF